MMSDEHLASSSHSTSLGIAAIDWPDVTRILDEQGWVRVPNLLDAAICHELASLYENSDHFRSKVIMAKHGYGRGEYRYFAYPLPALVEQLRTELYAHLAPIANRWYEALSLDVRFPGDHAAFIARCHHDGQTRPTPLLLRYSKHDYNCLHQDLYGEHVFPLQVAILLNEPGQHFQGGEFVLTEQRPRRQSRVMVAPLHMGDAIVFTVNSRPVQGSRGIYRASMRHGVSTIHAGQRHTLGIIFHDAT